MKSFGGSNGLGFGVQNDTWFYLVFFLVASEAIECIQQGNNPNTPQEDRKQESKEMQ